MADVMDENVKTAALKGASSEYREVPCPLCDSRSYDLYVWAAHPWGSEHKYRVTRCRDCGMIYTNPQRLGTLDLVRDRKIDRTKLHVPDQMVYSSRFQLALIRLYGGGRRILDFGCGSGSFTHEAAVEGCDSVGLDLCRDMAAACNQHWNFDRAVVGTADEFASANPQPFDVIFSRGTFEHIERPVETCKSLLKILKPGGLFYIQVPHAGRLIEWVIRGRTLTPRGTFNHFTRRTLIAMMRKIGCQVLYCSGSASHTTLFYRVGLGRWAIPLARMTKAILPPWGPDVDIIARYKGSA